MQAAANGYGRLDRVNANPSARGQGCFATVAMWTPARSVVDDRRRARLIKLWIQSLDDPGDEGHLLEPDRAHLNGLDMHPRFSPGGDWIVFTSDRAGFMDEFPLSGMFPQPYGGLYAIPVSGGSQAMRLTHDKWEDALPFWGSSSGTSLAVDIDG